MSLEWFKCLDGEIIPVKDCLTKCRLEERCQPLAYLHLAAEEREWTGKASTTQLINGTMYTFLKLTQPYTIDPDDVAFRIDGTKSHIQLEAKAKELKLPAELSTTDDGRNTIDCLEPENGDWTLTDYKRWGSYKVAKALGIVETGKKPDPSGAVYQKSGKWGAAGTPKMVGVFQQMPQEVDNWEAELQLNHYRILAMDKDISIVRLRVHALVRDGHLAVAYSRGVFRNTYLIPVKMLDDDMVKHYFHTKAFALESALVKHEAPEPCDNRECWDGNRCKGYCEVAIYCVKGLLHQQEGK